jgi:hypothetical protein
LDPAPRQSNATAPALVRSAALVPCQWRARSPRPALLSSSRARCLHYPRQKCGLLCSRRARPSSSRARCLRYPGRQGRGVLCSRRAQPSSCMRDDRAGWTSRHLRHARLELAHMAQCGEEDWPSRHRSSRWLSNTAPIIERCDRWIRHRAKAMPRRRHWSDPPLSCHVSSARAVLGRRYSRRQGAAALIRGARDPRRQGRVACATLVVKGAASSVHGARSPRRVCEMTGQAGPAVISVMLASSLPIWRSAVTGRRPPAEPLLCAASAKGSADRRAFDWTASAGKSLYFARPQLKGAPTGERSTGRRPPAEPPTLRGLS